MTNRINPVLVALALLLAACDTGTEPDLPLVRVQDLVLEARGDTATMEVLEDGMPAVAEWVSLDPAIVAVTPGGRATAISHGTARVRASAGGAVDTATVTVLPPVEIQLSELALVTDPQGQQGMGMRIRNAGGRGFYRLEFWKHDPDGSKRRILWYTSETVAEPGLDIQHRNFLGGELAEWVVAYAREPLEAEAVRTSCAQLDGAPEPCPSDLPDPRPTVDSVTVSPAGAVLAVGGTRQYTARAFAGGVELTGRPVVWSTPSPQVIALSESGLATALRPGYGQVNATVEGVTAGVGLTVVSENVIDSLVVLPLDLPTGTQGRLYAAQLTATGGDGLYAWTLTAGALPAGVLLGGGGALTGTPSEGGTFSFTARVTDGAGRSASDVFSLTVQRTPTIQTTTLPAADPGTGYWAELVATGGTGSYTWAVTQGSLPDGLTLSADGIISGTPTTAGSATFTVRVSDEAAATHERSYTLVVAETVVLSSGVPATGLAGDTGSSRYFGIDVPAGAARLTVTVSGGSGDVDLYVRYNQAPMLYTYDCRPLRAGNEETCTFTAPAAGPWYIMLRAFEAYADVTLVATVDM